MRELEYPFDSNYLLKKKRAIKKKILEQNTQRIIVRIAVLGGSTTTDIVSMLELFLLNEGIEPCFYESDYNKYWEDAVLGNPQLEIFEPEIVFVHTSFRNIRSFPEITDSKKEVEEKLENEYTHIKEVWEALEARYHCIIIQNNYEKPLLGTLGNQDVCDYRGCSNFVDRLNSKLYKYGQNHDRFYIHDVAGLAAKYGLGKWQNPRYWYMYKYSMHMEAIPEFAYNLSSIIKSLYGKNKKVIVVDADNTLWNGVIGECGADGIDMSIETSKGQSFREWQSYLKQLKRQGIMLAIASKNDEKNVIVGLKHPDSILKKEDFSAMAINWEDKATNIRKLANELNIGLEYMIFVDDNPSERELIQLELPQVQVIQADKPEQFLAIMMNANFFEVTELTNEDLDRVQMYADNKKRENEKEKYVDYNAFLLSLEMRAQIGKFEPIYYKRITQLINKTNQFNLTTMRLTEDEVIRCAENENWICLAGKLVDRFGDNGIVSILMAEKIGEQAYVHIFLMSCRVFKREMEYAMADAFFRECRNRNIKEVKGYYRPTDKNGMVKDFYKNLGFKCIEKAEDGATSWIIDSEKYIEKNQVIMVEETQ